MNGTEHTGRGELLLELLSEEIPARMQRRAIEDLVRHLDEWLQAHRIRPAEPLQGYVTPRRLTAIANGVPERLPEQKEERRGPRVGAPQAALDGFLRSMNYTSVQQCEIRNTERGKFYFAIIERPGRPTTEVLPEIVYSTIQGVSWPKSMRFPAARFRWVRPLKSVICLFDREIVALQLDRVPVGRASRGHRFLSPDEFVVEDVADYLKKLERAHVVLDHDRRREIIDHGLNELAQGAGLQVKPDPSLLDEVTGLVEYPVVLIGTIDADSMALPPEVLTTAMRTHQKYFTCLNRDGSTAPRFLFVANNKTPDDGATVIAGNERVLKARLADARFFWDQDRKVPLASRVEALKQRVYHERLGSVYDKVRRMEELADFLVGFVPGADAEQSRRAVHLAKADLSTGMVGEFPELQGIMGRYYALHDGEDRRVADAIAEHYKPLGPNDTCPQRPESIVAALADKLDSLAAFFFIREAPTGSRDPFALRRAALGLIRIILENRLRVPLFGALEIVAEALGERDRETANALEFVTERLEVHLRSEGVRYDIIKAAFLPTAEKSIEDDLVRLLARVEALTEFLGTDDGADLLVTFRRASNIVRIEAQKGGWAEGEVVSNLLRETEEKVLSERLDDVHERAAKVLKAEKFPEAMSALATLRRAIDEFFDKVTVNTDDPELRANRLRLLSRIRATMNQVADFSQIEG